jgi:hypothetical protein
MYVTEQLEVISTLEVELRFKLGVFQKKDSFGSRRNFIGSSCESCYFKPPAHEYNNYERS